MAMSLSLMVVIRRLANVREVVSAVAHYEDARTRMARRLLSIRDTDGEHD